MSAAPPEAHCPVCDQPVPVGTYCPRCRTRVARPRRSPATAWSLAGGAVLVLVMLLLWMQQLKPGPPQTQGASGPVRQPAPDGTAVAGTPVEVPFGQERCVPWHASAASEPPKAGSAYLVLTSKVADPYGLILSGFGEQCGKKLKSLIAEDLAPGDLAKAIFEQHPEAVVAAGMAAVLAARKEAPGIPLLFAMVPNPIETGLDGANQAGVSPWVPAEPLMHHVLSVLPPRLKLAVLYPSGPMAALAETAAAAARAEGRAVSLFEVAAPSDLDGVLERARAEGTAWLVFMDRGKNETDTFNRIQVAAEKARIPLAVSDEDLVRLGALVGAGPDTHRIGEQLCRLAGALSRGKLPEGSHVFCPEYSFGVIHQTVAEKLGYMLDQKVFEQAKLYKWH